ncbi:hypothetical protein RUE5091_02290 [Ruegeria denitrificans]|uniref:Uncharacterized protein n=1 Tax=Ruegeria denitrificans TaxID=1715692 RepID=A0A0P1IAP1_9RHOB|nr:hypothetical protein [Ruegeria denitrificans]CUK01754.1 hypothetical protein RUE5091_02290 [Ruegeria denitrificans]
MAGDKQLSSEQLNQILDALEARLRDRPDGIERIAPLVRGFLDRQKPEAKNGRSRSPYTGQLHFKVLEEDQIWFQQTARAYRVQQGQFFTHMRKLFETYR